MNIGGGLRFDKIESSRPDMEGAYTQNYGVLSYGQSFRVHAIEMNGRYYAVEPLSLAGQRTLKLANHLSGKEIVDLHSMSISGHTFQSGLKMDLSQVEADQLNAMHEVLRQAEIGPGVSSWQKIKMINEFSSTQRGIPFGLFDSAVRFQDLLNDPSLSNVGEFIAAATLIVNPIRGMVNQMVGLFEGLA